MRLNNRWLVVFMLWLICFINYADRQVIFVLFPLLRREFSLSNLQLGILSASFMVMYAVTGPAAGWICDRVSRRKLILGALLFWSTTTILTSLTHSYIALLAAIAAGGIGEAFYFPAAISLISDYHAPDMRSRAMALHQSGVYVGSVLGGWFAGLLGQHMGWRIGVRCFGAAGILLGILLSGALREPPRGLSDQQAGTLRREGNLWDAFRDLMRNRVARLLVLVFVGANFVAMVFSVWTPSYLFSRFHLSLSLAGLSGTAYMQIASIAGVVIGGFAADTAVQRSHGKGARMRVMAFGLLFALPALVISGWATRLAIVLLAMVGFGLGKGVYEASLWSSLYDFVPITRRGASVGIMNSLGWLGAATAQLIVGAASSHFSLGTCLSTTATIYLVIAIVLLYGARLTQRMGSSHVSAI